MDIGKSIRKNREFYGLSRQELADILEINVSTLGRYETGKRNPSLSTLKNISNVLSIDFDILIGWTDVLNTHPDVFDFLEKVFCNFDYIKKIAHLLGTNQHDKKFTDFFECNFSDKTLYLKTADILELTDTQLYNWILILRIKDDFYKNKLSYLRDYMPIEDSDRLDYMITSNKANLEIQPFDDLFFNGINNENKTKIKKYLEKIYTSNVENLNITEFYKKYGDDWRDVVINIESNPKFLLNSILKYLEEKNNFFSIFSIDLYGNKLDDLEYLTDNQINSIVKKVTDLVEYEIYKIEKENQGSEKKE